MTHGSQDEHEFVLPNVADGTDDIYINAVAAVESATQIPPEASDGQPQLGKKAKQAARAERLSAARAKKRPLSTAKLSERSGGAVKKAVPGYIEERKNWQFQNSDSDGRPVPAGARFTDAAGRCRR